MLKLNSALPRVSESVIPLPKLNVLDLLADLVKGADVVAIQRRPEAIGCSVVTLDPDLISHVLVGLAPGGTE